MPQEKGRYSRSEFLFLTAYGLWLLFAALRLTYIKQLFGFAAANKAVTYIVWILLACKLITDYRFGKKDLLAVALFLLSCFLIQINGASAILLPVAMVLSCRNVSIEKVLKLTIVIQLCVMAASVTLSLTGVIQNELWSDWTHRDRQALGYTYCTYGSHITLFMTLIYMTLRKRICLLEAALLMGINFVWYYFTDTKTDIILFAPAIMLVYFLSLTNIRLAKQKGERIFYMAVAPLAAVVSIAGQMMYDRGGRIWGRLNVLLNSRLDFGQEAIEEYGFTLFGQQIKWIGASGARMHPDWVYNYVDSSFLKYTLHYGIVFVVILLIGFVFMGKRVADSDSPGLKVSFLIWIAFGIIDAELFELAFQPFMLMLGLSLFDENAAKILWPAAVIANDKETAQTGITA